MSAVRVLAFCLLATLGLQQLRADPLEVLYPEGAIQAYLALRDLNGKFLASGLLTQVVAKDNVSAHLLFRFKDGSVDDDRFTFSQNGVFRLIDDHHVQRGPTFPELMDVHLHVPDGKVVIRTGKKDHEEAQESHVDLPPDLANGMLLTLLKNFKNDVHDYHVSYLAATPKPRVVQLVITTLGTESFATAGMRHQARHFRVKIELGGVAGLVAPLIGKKPADIDVWIATGVAPAFLKLESALFVGGPIWRSELTIPRWPST